MHNVPLARLVTARPACSVLFIVIVLLLPMLIAVGVGLTIINTRAVLEAMLGVKSGFVRTAKYAIGSGKVQAAEAKYRRKSGWLPIIELAQNQAVGVWVRGDFQHGRRHNFFRLPGQAFHLELTPALAGVWQAHQEDVFHLQARQGQA